MIKDSNLPLFFEMARLNPTVKPLGKALALRLFKDYPQAPDSLLCLIAVLAEKVESGNVCLDLTRANILKVTNQWLDVETLRKRKTSSDIKSIVSAGQNYFNNIADCGKFIPSIKSFLEQSDNAGNTLVLDDSDPKCCRLYFRRYYLYECKVAEFIVEKNKNRALRDEDLSLLAKASNILFQSEADGIDWQKIAAMVALNSAFSVITGGPGTGKTTTLVKLLLMLLSTNPKANRILLAAPTGKAAARVTESIASAFAGDIVLKADALCAILKPKLGGERLDGKSLLQLIPRNASTLHAILKVIPHQDVPVFNENRQLDCDIMVVDEVSMVDLPLFAKLCAALRPSARVILLGDMDQLFSVEAGSVLADICNFKPAISRPFLDFLIESCDLKTPQLKEEFLKQTAAGTLLLSEHTVKLSKSHRFLADSGIFRLSKLVNLGQGAQVAALLERCLDGRKAQFQDLRFTPYRHDDCLNNYESYLKEKDFAKLIAENCFKAIKNRNQDEPLVFDDNDIASYRSFFEYIRDPNLSGAKNFLLTPKQAQRAFAYLDSYRLLCSNRRGVLGQDNLNALIGNKVKSMSEGYLQEEWYPGKVVMITKNDQALGLHNGDVGFVAFNAQTEELTVFFPGSLDDAVAVNPVFLNSYEEGFAMTVHKSQGSEYSEVCLVLPAHENPVLTKELLYTGITRAKRQVRIYGSSHIITYACSHQVSRDSGLTFRLKNALCAY